MSNPLERAEDPEWIATELEYQQHLRYGQRIHWVDSKELTDEQLERRNKIYMKIGQYVMNQYEVGFY